MTSFGAMAPAWVFYPLAFLALASALALVVSREPLRAAVALLAHLVAIASLFLGLAAEMLAVLQIIVYAGATVTLMVFVVMMVGPQRRAQARRGTTAGLRLRLLGGASVAVLASGLVGALARLGAAKPVPDLCEQGGLCSAEAVSLQLAEGLFRGDVLLFELVGVLLYLAIVAVLAIHGPTNVARPASQATQLEPSPLHSGMARSPRAQPDAVHVAAAVALDTQHPSAGA